MMTVKVFVVMMMASILMFRMLFTLPPDGAHLLIAVSATLHLLSTSNGAKVLNRLIDRIPVNGRHK